MINNDPVWVEVNCVGETSGEKYFGKFQIKKYLTHLERNEVARLMDNLTRGIETDAAQLALMSTLAHLAFHVVEVDPSASWWGDKGLSLLDSEPAYALAAEIKKMQNPKKDEPKTEEPKVK